MNILVVKKRNATDNKIEKLLQENGHEVFATDDVYDVQDMAKSGWAQYVMFDRVMTATPMIREMRNAKLMLPITVLSDMQSKKYTVDALENGADDVIETPCDKDIILARMQAVHRRALGLADNVTRFGPLQVYRNDNRVVFHGNDIRLTLSEFKVMDAIALGKGRVVPDSSIEVALGFEPGTKGDNLIKVYVTKLRRKLEAAGAGNLVLTEWGQGYCLNRNFEILPAVKSAGAEAARSVQGVFGKAVADERPAAKHDTRVAQPAAKARKLANV